MNITKEQIQDYNKFLSFLKLNKEFKMTQDLKIGDIVTLKSDNLPMVIDSFENDYLVCVWKDTDAKFYKEKFHKDMLIKDINREF